MTMSSHHEPLNTNRYTLEEHTHLNQSQIGNVTYKSATTEIALEDGH